MTEKKEFGDFQTPEILAKIIVDILIEKNISPDAIIEPTCGLGSILLEANNRFTPQKTLGIEIQKKYTDIILSKKIKNVTILNSDFFTSLSSIQKFIAKTQNILFIGNPPWVTNSELSSKKSTNLPKKSNFDNIKGIDAITGKSNFDISEFIIKELVEKFSEKKTIYAFLCKTSVAKKIMNRLWKNNFLYNAAELYSIDSKKYFNAAVDSCLFILDCTKKRANKEMTIYESIENPIKKYTSGYVNNVYLEDVSKKECLEIYGKSLFTWRNGVKHDCSKVVELKEKNGNLLNGYNEIVRIESDLVFPFLKSSEVAKQETIIAKKILVTQTYVNEPTDYIKIKYPATWKYLNNHKNDFEKRKSIVYKNKCMYSMFSIGSYTFNPYKIAISGLYKSLNFKFLEPFNGKTVLLDDTCNFISFNKEEEAIFVYKLLNSSITKDYLLSRISWESKRPIKTEILNTIDLEKVAEKMNLSKEYNRLFFHEIQNTLLFA